MFVTVRGEGTWYVIAGVYKTVRARLYTAPSPRV